MRTTDRCAIAVMVAMLLGQFSLVPLTVDRRFLLLGGATVVLLELASLLLRRLRVPSAVVHLVQLLLLLAVAGVLGFYAQPEATRSLARLGRLWTDAVLTVRVEVAPMRASNGVRWLMVLLVGAVTIIADALVVSLASPAWSLAPLLTLYLIPTLALQQDVRWWVFALLGLAWLVVLVADGINDNATWTRNLAQDSAARPHSSLGAVRLAALLGVPAVALALGIGTLLPRIGNVDISSSRPRGNGPLQMADPTIDLSRNLNLPVDRTVITYTAPQPLYLRTASMTVVDASGWHMAPVQLQDGALPLPPGLTEQGKQVTATISVKDLGGEYLPAPYAPQSFDAPGKWRFDPLSLAIMSTEQTNRSDAIRNKTYTVTATLDDPQAEQFTLAQPGVPPDDKTTSAVPKDVPKAILDLTNQWTKDASTPVLKAAAIQRHLADPRTFSYSTTAPPGDGYGVLVNFLTRDHTGYCVHFAAAMALMARIEGIPSRVSVGFLPGEKVGDHYEVKASQMHAWPELYFQGYGWVRFEPTTSVAQPPDWTIVNSSVHPLPSASASAGATQSRAPSVRPTASSTPSRQASTAPTAPAAAPAASTDWGRIAGWVLGSAGVLLLLLLPAIVRALTRRHRLRSADGGLARVDGAWAEVRDTVRDLHLPWPPGTPREVHAALATRLDEPSGQAMEHLSLATERARYARSLGEVGEVGDDVRTVRRHLLGQAGTGRRLAAALLPASLWWRLRHPQRRAGRDDGRTGRQAAGGAHAAPRDEAEPTRSDD